MHTDPITAPWRHEHTFGQDRRREGERRTLAVAAATLVTMVAEIAAGLAFGSMALLADGLHMGSHATALGISAAAYAYARRRAADPGFSFGTGKVNVLAGYTGAVLLGGFALVMAFESVGRLLAPAPIAFGPAIGVAVLGLVVNGASVLILQGSGHAHGDDHHDGHGHRGHDDHNLRSAYLHVLADALTSVLAIAALLAGRHLGAVWLDPLAGVLGAALVAHWSLGLLRDTGAVLLDRQAPGPIREAVRAAVESDGGCLADLHVWGIGPGLYAAALSVVTDAPRDPDHYKALLPQGLGIVHVTVEVHERPGRSVSPHRPTRSPASA